MKIVYKCKYFIITEHSKSHMKTKIYEIYTDEQNNIYLGSIKWYPAWRKYCFFAKDDIIWDTFCLKYLIEFIDDLNLSYKESKKVED